MTKTFNTTDKCQTCNVHLNKYQEAPLSDGLISWVGCNCQAPMPVVINWHENGYPLYPENIKTLEGIKDRASSAHPYLIDAEVPAPPIGKEGDSVAHQGSAGSPRMEIGYPFNNNNNNKTGGNMSEPTDAVFREEMLGHGFIELIDHMGSDLDVINNAKVSFDRSMSIEEFNADQEGSQKFIDFLVRERHGSPLEAPEFKFRVKAPIFIFREWHRHRVAELNEESMRYSLKEKPEFYVPERKAVRTQVGKPGSYSFEPISDEFVVDDAIARIELAQHFSFRTYKELVNMGVAKELARVVIPVGTFSTMIWKANLRSILNFISLRASNDALPNGGHAQAEIRVYADAMERMISNVCPMVMTSFKNNGRVAP